MRLNGKPMEAKLELKELTKRFGTVGAVSGLSLIAREGEFLSLVGPSGCGKSTTLAMIAGLLQADGGDIVIDKRVVNDLPAQQRGVGLVFQDYAVFTSLSVEANLAFGLEVRGVSRVARKKLVKALAEQLNLTSLLKRRGGSLNMSEMQRVALARVLIVEPKLLLLDEPMSNLDASVRASLRGELRQIQRARGQTVFYVTHDQAEALSMSDRIAVMRGGKLLQIGTPEEIYQRPSNRFVAEFIGDPPINVIACDVRRDGGSIAVDVPGFGNVAVGRGIIDEGRHLIGVRPHDVIVGHASTPGAIQTTVRFIENFGAEHVLHLEYLNELIRATTVPGFAHVGANVYMGFDMTHAHLIEAGTDRIVPIDALSPNAKDRH